LETILFYRWQEIDTRWVQDDYRTNGVELSAFWDNRDFFPNPSEGCGLSAQLIRDFGAFNSSDSWTIVKGEFDQYLSLGQTETFRQRVIAVDIWTAYSPSWDKKSDGRITNRPPAYAGATLGGLFRLRGYPASRFNDKAAIHYTLEYRMVPEWNPLAEIDWLQKHLGIAWWQWVPFLEVGRVASKWSMSELHDDMKWDVGFGLRLMAMGLVVRADTAVSDESLEVKMFVGQPFQF
jgi:outer membrane protein assembly factor BamA